MIPDAKVTKEDAIAALANFRRAVRLISSLQRQALDRWSAQDLPETICYTESELDDYRAARAHLLQSLHLNPFNPQVHWLLANAYGEIDYDLEQQLAFYNSSLELDPADDDVLVARMGMHIAASRIDDAERDLMRLEQLGSGHAASMADHFRRLLEGGEAADPPESPSQGN